MVAGIVVYQQIEEDQPNTNCNNKVGKNKPGSFRTFKHKHLPIYQHLQYQIN